MSKTLICAIHAVADGQSWQLIPLYKEFKKRGWSVEFIIDTERLSSYYPLVNEGIDWKVAASFDLKNPEKLFDVIVEYNPALSPYLLKSTGISVGTVCGGTGNWLAISKSLCLVSLHNLWIGHNSFELENRRKEGFDETFPCIGMPSLSHFKDHKAGPERITGVYFNGPPFSPQNKKALNQTVVEFARRNPEIQVVIKERFLERDEGVHHDLTQFDRGGGCENIRVLDATSSVKEIIQNASFLFGVATTGFIEALYLKKPVFILQDHDKEIYLGVPGRKIYEHYAPGMTAISSNEFIYDFHNMFRNAHTLTRELYKELFPFQDPCKVVADMIEMIFDESGGREISAINFNLNYNDQESFRKDLSNFYSRFDSLKDEMVAEREILKLKYLILHNVLMRIRYIFPHLPHSVYRDLLNEINSKIAAANLLEEVIALFEDSGRFFYGYMAEHEEYRPKYLPDPETLFEKGSENYIKEALFYFKLHGRADLAKKLGEIAG